MEATEEHRVNDRVQVIADLAVDGITAARALAAAGAEDIVLTTHAPLRTYLETRPELVVLDPLGDDERTLRTLRSLAVPGWGNVRVPVVVIVDEVAPDREQQMLDAGAFALLRRECVDDRLRIVISDALETRRLELTRRAENDAVAARHLRRLMGSTGDPTDQPVDGARTGG